MLYCHRDADIKFSQHLNCFVVCDLRAVWCGRSSGEKDHKTLCWSWGSF